MQHCSKMEMAKKIIGVAGMPGAGKSLVVKAAYELGFKVVVMGDEVREEAKRRGIEATPENLGRLMLELREMEGPASIAKRCLKKIQKAKEDFVLVDGVRSMYEVEEFKKHFPNFILLAVHASPETRFRRLFKRRRSDDPVKWKNFVERDNRELKVGLGNVIALADYILVNEGGIEEFVEMAKQFLENVAKNG